MAAVGDSLIDPSEFKLVLKLQALRVPKTACNSVERILNGYLLDMPRLRHILLDPGHPESRLVLLSEEASSAGIEALPKNVLEGLSSFGKLQAVPHELVLDYSYWPADYILRKLLPEGVEVPTSFETVGHIAHLNLRDELLAYKKVIGQVLLEKNAPRIRTVVNKVGNIESEFRVAQLEVLAGNPSLEAEVRQHGARFRLDFGTVYWNSRLEAEHHRLSRQIRPEHVVCDLFAGIGPFAIPAAMAGSIVYANDLNPDSTRFLRINSELNHVQHRVHVSTMDARAFMRMLAQPLPPALPPHSGTQVSSDALLSKEEVLARPAAASASHAKSNGASDGADRELMEGPTEVSRSLGIDAACARKADGRASDLEGTPRKKRQKGPGVVLPTIDARPWVHFDHAIMNLPASAIEFLDVFKGLLSRQHWRGPLPLIHCYCFMRSSETPADVIKRAEACLGGHIDNPSVWTVRDVAPNKIMLCISFRLPDPLAFRSESVNYPDADG